MRSNGVFSLQQYEIKDDFRKQRYFSLIMELVISLQLRGGGILLKMLVRALDFQHYFRILLLVIGHSIIADGTDGTKDGPAPALLPCFPRFNIHHLLATL
jgi:hypothetical protein